jgi:hypothetical protein
MNRRLATALAHLTAAAVAATAGPAPAPSSLASAATPKTTVASGPARHCAVLVDTGKMVCAATPQAVRRALGPKANYLVAKLWKEASFRGDYPPYYKSSRCTATFNDMDVPVSCLPSGWNDQLSSLETDTSTPAPRCSLILHEHGNFGGRKSDRFEHSPYVRAFWNDTVSSWYIT